MIDERTQRLARGALMVIGAIWLIVVGLAVAMPAPAADAAKPRQVALLQPMDGLYVDQLMPGRYCVIETGEFGWFGRQTFLHCAAGYNNAGHNFYTQLVIGGEVLLYRLQATGALLSPAVVNSVTITAATADDITVRFGTPGAQSPAYLLTRQPRQPEPWPTEYIAAPWDWDE